MEGELRKVIANEGRHEVRLIAALVCIEALKRACLYDKGGNLISSNNCKSFIMPMEADLKILMKLKAFDRLL